MEKGKADKNERRSSICGPGRETQGRRGFLGNLNSEGWGELFYGRSHHGCLKTGGEGVGGKFAHL